MAPTKVKSARRRRPSPTKYLLRLYVTGLSPKSALAIQRIKDICESNLKDRYTLEVIDIYQHPVLARDEQIVATPTLVKVLPSPLRRYIGDLSNAELLLGLDLKTSKRR